MKTNKRPTVNTFVNALLQQVMKEASNRRLDRILDDADAYEPGEQYGSTDESPSSARRPPGGILPALLLAGVLMLFASPTRAAAAGLQETLNAVRWVESSNAEHPPRGDGGAARGPLQIHEEYWSDALEFDPSIGGTYADCDGWEYSQRVAIAYFRRYCPSALAAGDAAKMARCHHDGSSWRKKYRADDWYAARVLARLAEKD